MEKAQDIRTVRTCRALWEAMFALLETFNYEEITVLQLCKEAGVKRATFYLHYKDIDQFLDICLTAIFNELFPPISQDVPLPKQDEYLICLFKKIFDFVEENFDMLKLLVEKINSRTLFQLFYSAMCNEMTGKVNDLTKKGYFFKVPAEVLSKYYAGALIGLIKWWLMSGTAVTKEELTGYFSLLIKKEYVVHPFN